MSASTDQSPKRTASIEEVAFLNLQRTADALQAEVAGVLKPAGLSPTGFNVLHILRAAGETGLPSREIGQRMITRDPDLTRLLDRLEARGWVGRHRCDKDRRRVYSKITKAGAALLDQYDGPLSAKLREMLGHLGETKLGQLTQLLTDARSKVNPSAVECTGGATCSGAAAIKPPTCDGKDE